MTPNEQRIVAAINGMSVTPCELFGRVLFVGECHSGFYWSYGEGDRKVVSCSTFRTWIEAVEALMRAHRLYMVVVDKGTLPEHIYPVAIGHMRECMKYLDDHGWSGYSLLTSQLRDYRAEKKV